MPGSRVAGVILISLTLCSCAKNTSSVAAAVTSAAVAVKIIVARKEALTPEVSSFGSISYRSKADIATTVDGTVKRLAVEEGDHVKVGQLLAELDNIQLTIRKSQAESQLESAQASVELANAQLGEGRRQVEARLLSLKKTQIEIDQKKREADDLRSTLDSRERLYTVDGISEEQLHAQRLQYQSAQSSYEALLTDYAVNCIGLRDQDILATGSLVPSTETERTALLTTLNTQTLQAQLDSARANLKIAKADLQAANAMLDEMSIFAPVAGIIGARQCGVGERLRTADKLYTIIDDAQVYAVFVVPESKGMSLSEGMSVQIEVPALRGRKYHSTISIVSPLLDPQSGNLTVRAILPNLNGDLKPGLFIRVRVQTSESRQTILLPRSAVVGRNGVDASVYLVRDSRCFLRKIVLGIEAEGQSAGKLEVQSGVAVGDHLVDEPSPVLQDGAEVHAME